MVKNWKEEIIQYIKKNRVSTTEVADCLGKRGLLEGAYPLNKGKFCVGEVKWVYAINESNWTIHEMVRDTKPGEIVFMEAINCGERALVGELVSKYVLLYCQAEAIISNGKMRDAHKLLKENHSIWCNGVTPIGCFNQRSEEDISSSLREEHYNYYHGAIAVCDDSGVVIIPKENFNEEFYNKLIFIEEQEDIWFDCIDRRKWDTFDTVCLKKYKEDKK